MTILLDATPQQVALLDEQLSVLSLQVDQIAASTALGYVGGAQDVSRPNLGTGGAFTLTGTLTNASSSPSD